MAKYCVEVTGDTRPHAAELKAAGFRWESRWVQQIEADSAETAVVVPFCTQPPGGCRVVAFAPGECREVCGPGYVDPDRAALEHYLELAVERGLAVRCAATGGPVAKRKGTSGSSDPGGGGPGEGKNRRGKVKTRRA